MKHVISKELNIEEFKLRFSEIREDFLDSLKCASEGYEKVKYLSCDEDGVPSQWVWDGETFSHNKEKGTLEDAIEFATHMINDGMCFAFMGCLSEGNDLEIWLTTFEDPIEKPTWPSNKIVKFECIHPGVTRN